VSPLHVRWSEHEAGKPYARPFGVSFVDDDGGEHGSVAVSGQDLLYVRQFQIAVLTLGGELFDDPTLRGSGDPQRAWLDQLAAALPLAGQLSVLPQSSFDHSAGRVFSFAVSEAGVRRAVVDAQTLLDYQEFQAAIAHQSGRLYRVADVEAVDDPLARQTAWTAVLREMLSRPPGDEAMSETWPWR
jgi:hypothetical protein